VFDGFAYDFVGHTMQEYLEAAVLFALDVCYRVVCRPCSTLLELATPLFVLSLPVVELIYRSKDASRGDHELVHTEDCSMPGAGVSVVVLFEHRRMEIPVAVASMKCYPPKLVVRIGDVLRRRCVVVLPDSLVLSPGPEARPP
jgi:hypothetical protein